jgi:2-polyprenyl-3-methyl-5-hydroxy-6-metoxy-1,4-benzoquinol methylase
MDVKTRIPEESEEMNNYKEIVNYYKAHQILKRKYWDLYELISKNILSNVPLKGQILDVGCGYGGLIII